MKANILILSTLCLLLFAQLAIAQSSFDDLWKEVGKAKNADLPKTALEKVNTIYEKAKTTNNVGQMVKALVYRLNIEEQMGEAQSEQMEDYSYFRINKVLRELDAELKKATNPVHQSVLHLLKGKSISDFYGQNSWRINQRTTLAEYIPTDISTWSEKNLASGLMYEYNLAFKYPEKLKFFGMESFNGIVDINGNAKNLRPTMLEIIGFHIIESLQHHSFSLTQPINPFKMENESYFWLGNEFANLRIESEDTLSFEYNAIKTYQTLIKLNLASPEVLSDIELHKVQYVNSHYKGGEKEKNYQSTLEKLHKKYKNLPIYTEIAAALAKIYTQRATKYNPLLSDKFKWENKKALEICEEAVRLYPKSFGYNDCQSIIAQIKSESFEIEHEEVILPNQAFKCLATIKNTPVLNAFIYETTYEELEKLTISLHNENNKNYNIRIDKKIYDYYENKPLLRKQNFKIPDDEDYQSHKIELAFEPLKAGTYMIFWTVENELGKSNVVKYNNLKVSDLTYINKIKNEPFSLTEHHLYVLNRSTGEKIPNTSIEARKKITSNNNYYSIKIESAKTQKSDENGFARFVFEGNQTERNNYYGNTYFYVFRNGSDVYSTMDYLNVQGSHDVHYNQERYQNNYYNSHCYIFTDRSIYRPGQTVYFKIIMILTDDNGKRKILKNQSISGVLRDVNYKEVGSRIELKTNDYGSASGTFNLPNNGLTGNFTLDFGSGQVSISVEEYKRPKFEVLLKKPEASFRLNDDIAVKGNASALAGFGISNAKVSYKIQRAPVYPEWLYWRWRCWGYYPSEPSAEIKFGTVKTNEKGEFEISFKAIPDADVEDVENASFNYIITADVTDENGETRSATSTIMVSKTSLVISQNIKDKIEVSEAKKFTISTENTSGIKQNALVKLKVFKLAAPNPFKRTRLWARPDLYTLSEADYLRLFPIDEYKNELDIANWKQEKLVFEKEINTEKDSLVDFSFLSQTGKYYFIATANDKYGVEVKNEIFFEHYDKNEQKLSIPTTENFSQINSEVEIGENAEIKMGTSAKNQQILTEISFKNSNQTSWINLSDEVKLHSLKMTAEAKEGLNWRYIFVRNNRVYQGQFSFTAPSESAIKAEFITFRDKLQPAQKESWKIKFKDRKGKTVLPEILAGMYDASLDQFKSHSWHPDFGNIYINDYQEHWTAPDRYASTHFRLCFSRKSQKHPINIIYKDYPELVLLGFNFLNYGFRNYESNEVVATMEGNGLRNKSMADNEVVAMGYSNQAPASARKKEKKQANLESSASPESEEKKPEPTKAEPAVRKNLQETAFFMPHLETDSSGAVILNFTAPEALTRWRLLGLAHTKDLKYGTFEKTCITQKELMIMPNAPRFLRENDDIRFPAKVVALQNDIKNAEVKLQLFDALTMKPIDALFGNDKNTQIIDLQKGISKGVYWSLKIPVGISAVVYRVTVQTGNQSDGEENALPVLTNSMLVTESLPLNIRGAKTKNYTLENLKNNTSTTLRHHQYTLEFTPNPAWYAVQALPYLMEYPHECTEQLFSRFYANTMASYVANSNPKIKQVFDTWKNFQPDALLSNLEKNQELKALLIEETPWLRQAKGETEQKRRIALLFDLNRIADEKDRTIQKIKKRQMPSGAFPWFDGMYEDRYMTQHIICGLGKLQRLNMLSINQEGLNDLIAHSINYLDNQVKKDYQDLGKWKTDLEKYQPSEFFIHYLYTRSFFIKQNADFFEGKEFKYFQKQAVKYALQYSKYSQAMLGLAQHRFADKLTPQKVVKSLNEWALHSEEMGMYWKETAGYYWYEAPIERQTMMIEFYDEAIKDENSVDELKVWLLKQKQTTHWKTTKATTEAIYALLLRGTDFLANEPQVEITVGNEKIDPKTANKTQTEAGTGYFKTSWSGNQITQEMANIKIDKKDKGLSWGAVYWQYFEQLDKIKQEAQNPIKLTKKLFLVQNTASGEVLKPINEKNILKTGDLVKVRIEIKSDRNLDYIHLKDMRAAGFEPVNVMSQYKYQDGLGYYESTRDAATNFFIGYMPLGSYVFEYALRVQHVGNFSNGITSIQCMYAPEFGSHSEGLRVKVENVD